MTRNQLDAKKHKQTLALDERKHQETIRSNKEKEKIERGKIIAGVFGRLVPSVKLNHIEWYTKDKNAAESVANLPFTLPKGSHIDSGSNTSYSNIASAVIRFANTLPQTVLSGSRADGINLAARTIYAYNRSHNSGSINYEPADYMMYLLAVGDLFNLYAYLCKLVRTLNGYTNGHTRRDTPQYLIQSMGYNYSDLLMHKVDLVSLINALAKAISPFAVPGGMPYYERKLWLISNVFASEDSEYSPYYHFVPSGLWRYSERGLLAYESLPANGSTSSSNWTFEMLKKYVVDMINAVSLDEDFATMAGDTVKAYGDNILKMQTVSIEEIGFMNPVCDYDILNQIKSGNFVYIGTSATLNVYQNTDPESTDYGIIYQGRVGNPRSGIFINSHKDTCSKYALSVDHKDHPNYEDVLRCTRFVTLTENKIVDNFAGTYITGCGTEVLCGLEIIGYSSNADEVTNTYISIRIDLSTIAPQDLVADYMNIASQLYDLPGILAFDGDEDTSYYLINSYTGRNSIVNKDILSNINTIVFDSLLNISQFYKY